MDAAILAAILVYRHDAADTSPVTLFETFLKPAAAEPVVFRMRSIIEFLKSSL